MHQPAVTIDQGKLIGTISRDIDGNSFYSFRGIPYARPPLGKLRFKAPLPPLPWQGTFDATKNRDCCYSSDLFKKELVGSEDCLNLNVYTPTLPDTSKQLWPVMVWIHGGSFIGGSNSSDVYGPEFLITAKVVVVTVNYRLGLLGFLGMNDPSLKVPGNAGFKDMVMALKWVQKNIQEFNGNPNNVTLFGQSAGGAAVHLLMLSPMSQGLFHKAIAQSGCALIPGCKAKKLTEDEYKALGCEGKTDREALEYLENLPVETLYEKQTKIYYVLGAYFLSNIGVVIERKEEEQGEEPFMCEEPIDIILSRKYMNIPLIMGYTKLEGLLVNSYRPVRVNNMFEDFECNVPHFLGYKIGSYESKILSQKIKNFYYGNEEPHDNNRSKFYEMATDTLFLYGIYTSVRQHARNACPVYFYRMSLQTSLQFLQALMKRDQNLAATHCDDLSYLFKNIFTPPLSPDSIEYISIKKFVTLWTNFAYYGNPTLENSSVIWEKVGKQHTCFLDIDKQITFYSTFSHKNLDFWDKIYLESPGGNRFCNFSSKL